jgi:hypothetical protein
MVKDNKAMPVWGKDEDDDPLGCGFPFAIGKMFLMYITHAIDDKGNGGLDVYVNERKCFFFKNR